MSVQQATNNNNNNNNYFSYRRFCIVGLVFLSFMVIYLENGSVERQSKVLQRLGIHSNNNNNVQTNRPNFTSILTASLSDKCSRHHYERYYERWLEPMRDQNGLKLLELGANQGNSLKLWSEYFSNASLILGLAYGSYADGLEYKVFGLQSVAIYHGYQAKKDTMVYLQQKGPWDIIIDDGSHVPEHMIYSLFQLWNSVKPGGLYIIEDLETNYWRNGTSINGYPLPHTSVNADANHSAIAKIQQLVHVLTRHELGLDGTMSIMPHNDVLCSIEWGMNVVLLRKCGLPTDGPGPDNLAAEVDAAEIAVWVQQAKASNPSDN